MPGPLVIRNLTSIHLTLTAVERFDSPAVKKKKRKKGGDGGEDKVKSLTGNFTGLMSNVMPGGAKKRSQVVEILRDQKPLKREEEHIELHPFRTTKTQIPAPPTQVLRLTLEDGEDGTWSVDVPTPSGASIALKALSSSAEQGEFTAIHNDNSCVLAIFESTNMNKWMKDFPDSTLLSALSIPGTHNSPTCHQALPSVRCQAVSPLKQLENGVRFFDVRVQVNDSDQGVNSDAMELVHAVFPISLTGSAKARTLFDDIYAFLDKHPSETLILSLKREGRGNGTDAIFSERLHKHIVTPNSRRWHTRSDIPTLGEARGKVVLLRRFALSDKLQEEVQGKGGFGINATNWADNTPNHHGGDIQIQDFYEVTDTENIDKKISLVCEHFERAGAAIHPIGATHTMAAEGPKQPLFINFLSAANFWKMGCWPDKIAAKMNPAIVQFLCEKHDIGDKGIEGPGSEARGDGGLGVVVCDWVGEGGDWDLVRAIVGMNSRLLVRLQEGEGEDLDAEDGIGGDGRGRERGRGGRAPGRGRGRGGRGRGM